MNGVLIESPKDGARRLSASALHDGFKPTALYEYQNADGVPWCWRIRCDDLSGDKWIRPMRWNGTGYEIGEPPAPTDGKPLYRLPELLAADRREMVFIVEGEKCVEVLRKLGIPATTSGSATSAKSADWTPLAGRTVTIFPDNDEPGGEYASEVAATLIALSCKVSTVTIDALGLDEHGDIVDWLAANPNATADDVRSLACVESQSRGSRNEPLAEPEPLRRPVPPPEPYPIAELGPILAPACESIRRVIQAPDAVCGASLLAASSLAAQGLANVEIDGRTIPLSLWCVTVAESGERKSAVDSEAMRAAREYEKTLAQAHDSATVAHNAELEQWKAKCEHAKTRAKRQGGDGLADALQAIGPQPPPPLAPRVTVADFTAEGLSKLLATGLPSVGAFTDEAALVFGGHGMTKETVTRTAGTLCKLWDSGTLDRIRASEGAVKLYGRRLALHLMAQPVIAERALSNDVLAGQGFLARCLLAWPESTAGTRPYVAESLRDDAAMIRFTATLANLHARELPVAQGQRNELAPPSLRLTAEAHEYWRRAHDTIEAAMASGARFATAKSWASKTPEQVLRIAGVLTLIENHDASKIHADKIERAVELALWHLNEAVRLAGTAELSPEVRDAEALLNWCHETGKDKLHSRDALRLGPSRIRERERFIVAMGELERAGWAGKIEGGMELDGKHRRNVWWIAPKSGGC